MGAGGDARIELVADQPGQLEDRAALRRGAQEALVGDALLVEGEDVADAPPSASSSAMAGSSVLRVVSAASGWRTSLGASSTTLAIGSCASIRRRTVAMRASAVGERREARAVVDRGSATPVVQQSQRPDVGRARSSPALQHEVERPFSGRLGSLSRRAISSRCIADEAGVELAARRLARALEARRPRERTLDARHLHRARDDLAEIHRLAEREVVRMEEAAVPSARCARAEARRAAPA